MELNRWNGSDGACACVMGCASVRVEYGVVFDCTISTYAGAF